MTDLEHPAGNLILSREGEMPSLRFTDPRDSHRNNFCLGRLGTSGIIDCPCWLLGAGQGGAGTQPEARQLELEVNAEQHDVNGTRDRYAEDFRTGTTPRRALSGHSAACPGSEYCASLLRPITHRFVGPRVLRVRDIRRPARGSGPESLYSPNTGWLES